MIIVVTLEIIISVIVISIVITVVIVAWTDNTRALLLRLLLLRLLLLLRMRWLFGCCLYRFCFSCFEFAEGRSSIGIKSSSSTLDKILLSSSITSAVFFCGLSIFFFSATGLLGSAAGLFISATGLLFAFFSAVGCCTGAVFSVVSVVFSATTDPVSTALGAASFAFSTSFFSSASAFLRGRPTLRLGAVVAFSDLASTTGASLSLFVLSSFLEGCCAFTGMASLVLVTSPFFVAETTLSSFLAGATRKRFFFCSSFLRSSLSLSAATFLVAPTIACSSSIL